MRTIFASLLLIFAVSICAQVDSTFISYYYPNIQTSPYWDYIGNSQDTKAANVFEMYNGNFVLQALGIFHTPPPEFVYYQSPMMIYNREGYYQNSVFGPFIGQDTIVDGYFTRIIKDGLGGYLANSRFPNRIARLDANLQFIEYINLAYNFEENLAPDYIIPATDGFVVIGSVLAAGLELWTICAKYDYNFNMLWHYSFLSHGHEHNRLNPTSDGGYLFSWWHSPSQYFFKTNASGDSLWIKNSQTPFVSELIESNNKYYGLNYSGFDMNSGRLSVYNYGENFSVVSPDSVFLSIVTERLLYGDEVFSTIRTADNNIVLLVSTPNGEIFKYDSDFDLIWSSDNLVNDRIGCGTTPVTELNNGDLLYCARLLQGSDTDKFALVRVNSSGQVTPVDDDYHDTPFVNQMSVYPNPFNHFNTVSFSTPKTSKCELIIYNIKGQAVKHLVSSTKSRGIYKAEWNAEDDNGKRVSSGVYFYRLNIDGHVSSKKMVLMK